MLCGITLLAAQISWCFETEFICSVFVRLLIRPLLHVNEQAAVNTGPLLLAAVLTRLVTITQLFWLNVTEGCVTLRCDTMGSVV